MDRGIVIFDGDCGLCNGFVRWLMRVDRHGRFAIASNADEVGKAALEVVGVPWGLTSDTLVVIIRGTPLLRSAAVLGVLRELSRPWRVMAGAVRLVPRRLRDAMYDAVARRRKVLSGRVRACRVADADERRRWSARLATVQDVEALAVAARTS